VNGAKYTYKKMKNRNMVKDSAVCLTSTPYLKELLLIYIEVEAQLNNQETLHTMKNDRCPGSLTTAFILNNVSMKTRFTPHRSMKVKMN
jgi:hypothetical protein